ncbi:PDR/VanB family oxidoreductase [Kineosporia mesophila]|uniref:PDR/VanB family oxidoreductase n=1 Tax=Kineosporia mesophila TaxID=566012 RepID=UPI001E4B99A8|nr:PDR/VanB family oxidoreductase [Kineosporia mesophila]MCD5348842.1 PDR/VanB family oxidoreductase [Kineosporia mesophila]
MSETEGIDVDETFSPYLVRGMRIAADEVMLVELEPLEAAAVWEPGAHLDVMVGDGTTRQFSICGGDSGSLTVAVRRETPGKGGSAWIHDMLRPGWTVQVRGPRNHFVLEDSDRYLFVAGGIGITPLLPMLEKATDWELLYFGRTLSAMPFRDRLAGYGNQVRLLPADAPERPLLADLLGSLADRTLVYTCGPARLMDGVREVLEAQGRGDDLRSEYFSAPVAAGEAETGAFTVRLATSGQELKVDAGRSLLDVLTDEAGADILRDCEEGICGTCETRVVSGTVEHRDYVLTKTEKEAGDCLMVCVSRASGLLVLDL